MLKDNGLDYGCVSLHLTTVLSCVSSELGARAPHALLTLGSKQDRGVVPMKRSRGVSGTGRLWLFSPAAAPTWSAGRSWTGRLPPEATRTYPAGSPTNSTAAAWRCVAVALWRIRHTMTRRVKRLTNQRLQEFQTFHLFGWSISWSFSRRGRTWTEGARAARWCGRCGLKAQTRYFGMSTFCSVEDKTDAGNRTNRTNLPHGRNWLLTRGQTDNLLWPARRPAVHIYRDEKMRHLSHVNSQRDVSAGARLTMQAVLQMSAGVS